MLAAPAAADHPASRPPRIPQRRAAGTAAMPSNERLLAPGGLAGGHAPHQPQSDKHGTKHTGLQHVVLAFAQQPEMRYRQQRGDMNAAMQTKPPHSQTPLPA